jgi:hypothetical protein
MPIRRTKKTVRKEAVNHPAHYGGADNPYEAIKVIEAWKLGQHRQVHLASSAQGRHARGSEKGALVSRPADRPHGAA